MSRVLTGISNACHVTICGLDAQGIIFAEVVLLPIMFLLGCMADYLIFGEIRSPCISLYNLDRA
jgi:hypothetical protein